MKKYSFLWLVIFVLVAEGAGLLGLFFMGSVDIWYATLSKPLFNPPAWLFGPVWTVLYGLMGVAAYLVWQEKRDAKVLHFYWAQLVVNALWTPLFFGLQSPLIALIDIAVLLILIISTIIVFAQVNRAAAALLIPYLLWVAFASYLNIMIVFLN